MLFLPKIGKVKETFMWSDSHNVMLKSKVHSEMKRSQMQLAVSVTGMTIGIGSSDGTKQ